MEKGIFVIFLSISYLFAFPFSSNNNHVLSEKELKRKTQQLARAAKSLKAKNKKIKKSARGHCKKALQLCFKEKVGVSYNTYNLLKERNGKVYMGGKMPFKILNYSNKDYLKIKIKKNQKKTYLKFDELNSSCFERFKNNCIIQK